MTFKTLSEITQDVIVTLSQVPGTSVQTYSEDRIALFVQDAFDIAFHKKFWDEYVQWYTSALDGTTGLLTDTTFINEVTDAQDIDNVYRENSDRVLPKFPATNKNRVRFATTGGTTPRYYDTNPNSHPGSINESVIKIYPETSIGNVNVRARRAPARFTATDIIRIDHLYLRYLSAWFYLTDDGTNPDAMEKYEILAEDRFQVITGNEDDDIVDLDSRSDIPPNDWRWG